MVLMQVFTGHNREQMIWIRSKYKNRLILLQTMVLWHVE